MYDDQIGFQVHRTDLQFTQYARENLGPFGVTPEQNLLLLLLDERPGLTQVEIGRAMVKDKTNVARLVAGAEAKGLVARANPAGDRRSLVVTLTEAGAALVEATRPVAARFQRHATRGLSPEDVAVFTRVLTTLQNNLCS